MKALLIPLLMAAAGTAGGYGAGYMLGPKADPYGDDTSHSETGEAGGHSTADGPEDEVEFARLNNQFIVPVVEDEELVSLVVLSLTLEVAAGGTETVFQQEPRLRDRFLSALFDHANVGGFDVGFTQTGTLAILRRSLREVAVEVLGDTVYDVLIVDIVRQEV